MLIRKDAQNEPERRACAVDQQAVEAMLADRARSLGIEVRRECDVTGFVQQADGVDVEWASPTGGGRIRCSYLVGCDGGRSASARWPALISPARSDVTMYQAIAEIDHPERLLPMGWRRTSGGMFSYGFQPGRLFMLDFSGPPEDRQAPVTCEEIEAVLRRSAARMSV
jgi:2-polyprenyl-6-methoxyphenol hydroxylase-like FAD-dependent oxidoreductase